jgi:Ca2+-binding RTX toxin-like protein
MLMNGVTGFALGVFGGKLIYDRLINGLVGGISGIIDGYNGQIANYLIGLAGNADPFVDFPGSRQPIVQDSPKQGAYSDEAARRFGDAEQQLSPLTLDLDADGLDLISVATSTAFFDLDNDGFVERVGWVAPDDALLVLDRDGNGLIETRNELFGGSPSDGFASLRLLDTNADNRITAADARFAELRVWRDLNGNGVSEANELQSLTAAGIASISLASTHLTTPQTIAGNAVTDTSTFTWSNGTTGLVADVWFTVNQAFSFDARPVEITPEALFLPTLRGYGTISSLTAQMSRDPTLLALVQDFVATPITAITDAQIRDIMYRWAGVDGVHPTSRHRDSLVTVDSRKIAFLERFLDDPYTQGVYGSYASSTANADLEAAFAAVFNAVKPRLVLQAHLSDVAGIGAFDYLSDSFAPLDLQAALNRAGAHSAALTGGLQEKLAWWKAAAPFLGAVAAEKNLPSSTIDAWTLDATRAGTGFALTLPDLDRTIITGTAAAETRTGTAAAEFLHGGGGGDTLVGAGGDDIYLVARGDGQDRIREGGGAADMLVLGAGILPPEVTLGRAGTNFADLVITIAGGDAITLENYFFRNVYGDYNGRIEALRFADGTAWDYSAIVALVNAPTAGNDTILGDYFAETLHGGAGNDSINGRHGDDVLYGGTGADTVRGDELVGSVIGNDIISGGTGNDLLDGGRGNDVYLFVRGDGQDTISETGFGHDDGGVDRISFAVGILPSDVTLARTGASPDDLTFRIAGGDQITAPKYFGLDIWSFSSFRIEYVRFADGTIWDYATILGNFTTPSVGHDHLFGDIAANALSGQAGNDTIDGRNGNDTLDGGTGSDRLLGGFGDDLFLVDSATDIVMETVGQGTDEIRATSSTFTLGGHVERLVYVGAGTFAGTGTAGVETIIGGAGADTLRGLGGNDDLRGGGGADVLVGGAGADTLTGGAGADALRYEVWSEPGTGANADRITDFSQADGDKIHLATIDANTTIAGDQAFIFLGTGAFQAGTRGQLRHENRADGNTWVQGDLDGNALPDFEIVLLGTLTPTAAAFVL